MQHGGVVGGVERAGGAARVGGGVGRARRAHAQRARARQVEARVQVAGGEQTIAVCYEISFPVSYDTYFAITKQYIQNYRNMLYFAMC